MAKKISSKEITDLFAIQVDKKIEAEVFELLSNVENFREYLRATLADDMKRYFAASTPMEQLMIRGAAERTKYFLKMMKERSVKVKQEAKVVLRSPRHA